MGFRRCVRRVGSADRSVIVGGTPRDVDLSVPKSESGSDPYVIFKQKESEIDEEKLRRDMRFDLLSALGGPYKGGTVPNFTYLFSNTLDWILWDRQADKDVLYFWASETNTWEQEKIDINAVLGGRINSILPHRSRFIICPKTGRTVTDYDIIRYTPTNAQKVELTNKPAGFLCVTAGDYTGDGFVFAYLRFDNFLKQKVAGLLAIDDKFVVTHDVSYLGQERKAHDQDMHVACFQDLVYVTQFDYLTEHREWYYTTDLKLKKWGTGAHDTCERMIAGKYKFDSIIESDDKTVVVCYAGIGSNAGKYYVESYTKNPAKPIEPATSREYSEQTHLYSEIDNYTVSYHQKNEVFNEHHELLKTFRAEDKPKCGLCGTLFRDEHLCTYIGGMSLNATEMHKAIIAYLNDEWRCYDNTGLATLSVQVVAGEGVMSLDGGTVRLKSGGRTVAQGVTASDGKALIKTAEGVYDSTLEVEGVEYDTGPVKLDGLTALTVQINVNPNWNNITNTPTKIKNFVSANIVVETSGFIGTASMMGAGQGFQGAALNIGVATCEHLVGGWCPDDCKFSKGTPCADAPYSNFTVNSAGVIKSVNISLPTTKPNAAGQVLKTTDVSGNTVFANLQIGDTEGLQLVLNQKASKDKVTSANDGLCPALGKSSGAGKLNVAAADENGNITAREIAAGGASNAGDLLNVREFGAKGDGVADDTAAILAAIAASDKGKKVVFFPYTENNYKVASDLVITHGVKFTGVYVDDRVTSKILFYGPSGKINNTSASVVDFVVGDITLAESNGTCDIVTNPSLTNIIGNGVHAPANVNASWNKADFSNSVLDAYFKCNSLVLDKCITKRAITVTGKAVCTHSVICDNSGVAAIKFTGTNTAEQSKSIFSHNYIYGSVEAENAINVFAFANVAKMAFQKITVTPSDGVKVEVTIPNPHA